MHDPSHLAVLTDRPNDSRRAPNTTMDITRKFSENLLTIPSYVPMCQMLIFPGHAGFRV